MIIKQIEEFTPALYLKTCCLQHSNNRSFINSTFYNVANVSGAERLTLPCKSTKHAYDALFLRVQPLHCKTQPNSSFLLPNENFLVQTVQ